MIRLAAIKIKTCFLVTPPNLVYKKIEKAVSPKNHKERFVIKLTIS